MNKTYKYENSLTDTNGLFLVNEYWLEFESIHKELAPNMNIKRPNHKVDFYETIGAIRRRLAPNGFLNNFIASIENK